MLLSFHFYYLMDQRLLFWLRACFTFLNFYGSLVYYYYHNLNHYPCLLCQILCRLARVVIFQSLRLNLNRRILGHRFQFCSRYSISLLVCSDYLHIRIKPNSWLLELTDQFGGASAVFCCCDCDGYLVLNFVTYSFDLKRWHHLHL